MKQPDSPKYTVLIRLGNFRLDLVGRSQILGATVLIAGLVGLKLYFVHF